MVKKIKLMAEYNYSPLWDIEEVDNIELDQLPLSVETVERLLHWAKAYDQIMNWDDPASSGFASEQEREAFEREGIALWRQLQQELAPEYQVFYFSEKRRKLLKNADELASVP